MRIGEINLKVTLFTFLIYLPNGWRFSVKSQLPDADIFCPYWLAMPVLWSGQSVECSRTAARLSVAMSPTRDALSASHLPGLLSFGQPLCKLDNTKLLLPHTGTIDGAIYDHKWISIIFFCFLSFDDILRFTKKHAINTMPCLHKIQ